MISWIEKNCKESKGNFGKSGARREWAGFESKIGKPDQIGGYHMYAVAVDWDIKQQIKLNKTFPCEMIIL